MKPIYYDKFNCIADKCDFTCCQEWKIAVDKKTFKNWKCKNAASYLEKTKFDELNNSNDMLSDYVCIKDNDRIIKLNDNNKCPFLNKNGLCNIVLKDGENAISNTCHIFPREVHEYGDYIEQTLMLCCPHVIDMLNAEESFRLTDNMSDIPEIFKFRNKIIDFIQEDIEASLEEKLLVVFYILLEKYGNNEEEADLWLLVPELLNTIRNMQKNFADSLNEANELTLDLIDNYLKEGLYKEYLEWISDEANDLEDLLEFSKEHIENETEIYKAFSLEWKKFEKLLVKVIAQECYGELVIEADDMEGMLIKYQWIVMEYILFKHFSYLHFRKNKLLDYNSLKKYMVLAFRIMGFDDDDIYEYLENSFEEIIWQWGYMALLMVFVLTS